MRLIFMGTPEFAVPILDALYCGGHEIVAVVSQPDREKDKKGNILATPVKRYALSHGILCRSEEHTSELQSQR